MTTESVADPVTTDRVCSWCRGPIPPGKRRDAETCSQSCRQARHRFTTAAGSPLAVEVGRPRRLAYADPPYPGLSARYYGDHPDYAGEVDHAALLDQLTAYDAWALSTSASALPYVLSLCPPGVRVAAWFRGSRHNSQAGIPQQAWEPVIYAGQIVRKPSRTADGDVFRHGGTRRVDALVHVARPRTTDPDRVIGAKSATFARWLFDLLGATPDDTLDDLFPGSGGILRAWNAYTTGRLDP